MYTISIVEDEAILRDELAFHLEHHGFRVEAFKNAAQFYRYLAARPSTIAVLDIGLEGEDGLSICEYLRSYDLQMGIVFVTARSLRDDRLTGLDAGADAYLVKPVDIDELVLILKRLAQRFTAPSATLPNAGPHPLSWKLDAASGFLTAPNGARIRISMNEFQLLGVLFKTPGTPCSHTELAVALGLLPDEYDKHRVEVIFSRLRDKVTRHTGLSLPIQVERGVGYRLAGEPAA
jgi:two-component system, OmpR family, response regulator PhoP